MSYKKIFIGLLSILMMSSYAQEIEKHQEKEFTISTQHEPDDRRASVKVSDNEFVTIVKVSGKLSGPSDYLLEKYNKDLDLLWSTPFVFDENQDFDKFVVSEKGIHMLIENHDMDKKIAKLEAWTFDLSSGKKIASNVIQELKVEDYKKEFGKGTLSEDLQGHIESSMRLNYVTPLQYQFNISFSPDGTKFLSYIFDHAKTKLVADAKIFDVNLNTLDSGAVPIDNGYINHTVGLNDAGEVIIVNANRGGKITVVRYHLTEKHNTYISDLTTTGYRDNLKLKIINNDIVYIGNINKKNSAMVGVTYTKFNFATEQVEKTVFTEINDELTSKIHDSQDHIGIKGEEDWRYYELVDFSVTHTEDVLMILEKREFHSHEHKYDDERTQHIEHWYQRIGEVHIGNVLFFAFDKEDKLKWSDFIIKDQKTDLEDGTTSASYVVNFDVESTIRIAYAGLNKFGALTDVNYLEIDEETGEFIKNYQLPNENRVTLLRTYSIWFDHVDANGKLTGSDFVFVGKKGLIGKKTYIIHYKL